MIQSIISFISNHPEACISLFIIFCTILVTYGKFSERFRRIDKELNIIAPKIDSIILSFNRLIGKLEKIKDIGMLNNIYIKTASPKTLTEHGIKMLNESGLKTFIDTHQREIIKKVKSQNPKTTYDIEQVSIDTMVAYNEDARINNIKEYTYKNGLDLGGMLMASGIYLRDLILNKKEQ